MKFIINSNLKIRNNKIKIMFQKNTNGQDSSSSLNTKPSDSEGHDEPQSIIAPLSPKSKPQYPSSLPLSNKIMLNTSIETSQSNTVQESVSSSSSLLPPKSPNQQKLKQKQYNEELKETIKQQEIQQQQLKEQLKQLEQQQEIQKQLQQHQLNQKSSKQIPQLQIQQQLQQSLNGSDNSINNSNNNNGKVKPATSNQNLQINSIPILPTSLNSQTIQIPTNQTPVPLNQKSSNSQMNNNISSTTSQQQPVSVIPSTDNTNINNIDAMNLSNQSYVPDNSKLRNIYVPEHLPEKFLKVAKVNTDQNLETCGILCGHLSDDNKLFIDTIIIPKQTASSDTCNTLNEIEVLNYQQRHNLLTLGWIHTHPSQTCFLSSVDLHTQFSYQVMLPEAIAIVCSPKFQPNIGYFRLTDTDGMPIISNCNKTGFHPHHENAVLFYDAHEKNHGHVYSIKSGITIIDLRTSN